MEYKYIVYLTENTKCQVNGLNRIYVGVHKTKDPNVFDGYIGGGTVITQPSSYMHPKSPFQYAVKKYGVSAFKRNTLYIFDTAEQAYKKEHDIVDLAFIDLPHTYNVAIGGDYTERYKPLYQFDLNGNLVKEWQISADAYDYYGIEGCQLDGPKRHKTDFMGFYWSTTKEINIQEFHIRHDRYVTYLYSKDGKFLKEFESLNDCSRFLNKNSGTVCWALKTSSLIQNKYYISYSLVDLFVPKPRIQYSKSTFYVYTKDNEFLGTYVGKELMPVIGLNSWEKISNIFRSGHNWFKDFYLSFSPVEKVPAKKYLRRFEVDVYDKYGNFIETLPTIQEVKNKYKVPASKIQNVQRGDKYFGDYIFKYNSK